MSTEICKLWPGIKVDADRTRTRLTDFGPDSTKFATPIEFETRPANWSNVFPEIGPSLPRFGHIRDDVQPIWPDIDRVDQPPNR